MQAEPWMTEGRRSQTSFHLDWLHNFIGTVRLARCREWQAPLGKRRSRWRSVPPTLKAEPIDLLPYCLIVAWNDLDNSPVGDCSCGLPYLDATFRLRGRGAGGDLGSGEECPQGTDRG